MSMNRSDALAHLGALRSNYMSALEALYKIKNKIPPKPRYSVGANPTDLECADAARRYVAQVARRNAIIARLEPRRARLTANAGALEVRMAAIRYE